ncbi:MAG: acyl carrier protein [Pseudomonadota bacterium]|nr:acyl carrier protein [Pseudomonadota bacterium]
MQQDEIYAALPGIFEDVFEYEGGLGPETTSADIEDWDSIGHIRLVLAIEEKFGIRFEPKEVVGLKNLGDLVDQIARKAA